MKQERASSVLVVDDIQSNIEFVTDVLELEKITIYSAKNGNEAISLAKEKKPDLILLDISMPGMDGYEVCRQIKGDEQTCQIPIIFLTARVQKEDILRGFELGAVDYITKPFNFSELTSRVKTHIDLKVKTEQLQRINLQLESEVEKRTEQVKIAFSELQKANTELLEANRKLSQLDKAKTDFVLHINHELRTPLNGIQGYIGMLSETASGEPLESQVKAIGSLTQRLIKVAELSLLFTELNMRDEQITMQCINLIDSLNVAIADCDYLEKNMEFEIENSYTEIYVEAEPKLLETCLTIVIDNAIKYSPANAHIQIVVDKFSDSASITLLDNGPGFSQKSLDQLFSFFTADNLSHNSYGFGIGLATAKIILNVIGGKIEIANRETGGAQVVLSFSTRDCTKLS